jgi:hypothetical protein
VVTAMSGDVLQCDVVEAADAFFEIDDDAPVMAFTSAGLATRWGTDPLSRCLDELESDGRVDEAEVVRDALSDFARRQALNDVGRRRAAMAARTGRLRRIRAVYPDIPEVAAEQAETARALTDMQRRAADEA